MDCQQQIEFSRIRTTKEIFSDFLFFLKTEWKSYGIALCVTVLPFALISAYFVSTGDITDIEDNSLFYAILISLIGKFFGTFISCAYVANYINGNKNDFDTIKSYVFKYFNLAFLTGSLSLIILILGLLLYIIPALLVLPPLSFMMYDALFAQQRPVFSFVRCIKLCKTNWKQCFAVVYLCYGFIFFASLLLGTIIPESNNFATIFFSSILTVASETIMIPFILLYYSLGNQNMQI